MSFETCIALIMIYFCLSVVAAIVLCAIINRNKGR